MNHLHGFSLQFSDEFNRDEQKDRTGPDPGTGFGQNQEPNRPDGSTSSGLGSGAFTPHNDYYTQIAKVGCYFGYCCANGDSIKKRKDSNLDLQEKITFLTLVLYTSYQNYLHSWKKHQMCYADKDSKERTQMRF
ncbi:unnamed protein product [Lactuca saligna]|uniref:Uncharacterized protein n=1 Tax=Lactuca saligna TaxID=75948 RepID=A0AA35ZW55_LACSI|nr:unnamed protein product [Lactuca saligna]